MIYLTSVYHFLAKKSFAETYHNLLLFFSGSALYPVIWSRCFLERQTVPLFVWFVFCIPDWRWRWEPKPKGHPSLTLSSLGLSASQLLMHENNGSFTVDYRLLGCLEIFMRTLKNQNAYTPGFWKCVGWWSEISSWIFNLSNSLFVTSTLVHPYPY